jgi:hypothetical protein
MEVKEYGDILTTSHRFKGGEKFNVSWREIDRFLKKSYGLGSEYDVVNTFINELRLHYVLMSINSVPMFSFYFDSIEGILTIDFDRRA